jgi:hypothetical protein
MVKEDIKPIFRPGLDPLNTHTISDKLYCISDTIKVLATMVDRYGNLIRNQQYQFWGQHLRERLDAFPFQSMFKPDGRHAYNPAGRQYSQTVTAETHYASGRRAETPLDRVQAYEQVRPDPWSILPNVPYEMHVRGIHDAPRNRSMTAPYGTGPGGYQGQPFYGGMGAQPGSWGGYASARR